MFSAAVHPEEPAMEARNSPAVSFVVDGRTIGMNLSEAWPIQDPSPGRGR
jgi:hypothetical protein